MFAFPSEREIVNLAMFNLLSANTFNLVRSKILLFGKGLSDENVNPTSLLLLGLHKLKSLTKDPNALLSDNGQIQGGTLKQKYTQVEVSVRSVYIILF